jgi:hypothetical protein
MLSGGSDGEGVEVVGEDRLSDRGSGSVEASEAAAAQSVATFEVTDAAFGSDAVARQPAVGAFGAGALLAGDVGGGRVGQVLADGAGLEATVDGDLARS